MIGFLWALGRIVRSSLAFVGSVSRLNWALAARVLAFRRLNLRLVLGVAAAQIRFTGLEAIPLVASVALLIGAVTIVQAVKLLTGLADDLIGQILVTIIVREIGPLFAAVVLIGRSGTAMATEIGSMRLNGEIEALKAYRIDPLEYVVLPRVLASSVSLFCLIVVFDLAGLLGGYLIAWGISEVPFALFAGQVMAVLVNGDLFFSALKAFLFGHLVAVLACYYGLSVGNSPTELPQAVTKAVVTALGGVFAVDGLAAAAFYLS